MIQCTLQNDSYEQYQIQHLKLDNVKEYYLCKENSSLRISPILFRLDYRLNIFGTYEIKILLLTCSWKISVFALLGKSPL